MSGRSTVKFRDQVKEEEQRPSCDEHPAEQPAPEPLTADELADSTFTCKAEVVQLFRAFCRKYIDRQRAECTVTASNSVLSNIYVLGFEQGQHTEFNYELEVDPESDENTIILRPLQNKALTLPRPSRVHTEYHAPSVRPFILRLTVGSHCNESFDDTVVLEDVVLAVDDRSYGQSVMITNSIGGRLSGATLYMKYIHSSMSSAEKGAVARERSDSHPGVFLLDRILLSLDIFTCEKPSVWQVDLMRAYASLKNSDDLWQMARETHNLYTTLVSHSANHDQSNQYLCEYERAYNPADLPGSGAAIAPVTTRSAGAVRHQHQQPNSCTIS